MNSNLYVFCCNNTVKGRRLVNSSWKSREEDRISSSSASTLHIDHSWAGPELCIVSLYLYITLHFHNHRLDILLYNQHHQSSGSHLKSKLKMDQNKNTVVWGAVLYCTDLIDLQIIAQHVLIVIIQFIIIHNSVTSTRNTFQTDYMLYSIEISFAYSHYKGALFN